jgi:hypothetical protein
MEAAVERVRMALAEVGIDPDVAYLNSSGRPVFDAAGVDRRLIWRAKEVAGAGRPMCWGCWDEWSPKALRSASASDCDATSRLVDDCGRTRPASVAAGEWG